MTARTPDPLLVATLQPWYQWFDQNARLVEAGLEWQRALWQPWMEWQWALACRNMEQLGLPWLVRGEEQLA
jgi:hypothetical protein